MKFKSITVSLAILSSLFVVSAQVPVAGEGAGTEASPQDIPPVEAFNEAAADSASVDMTQLEDFVIVQQKKLVTSDGAKLTYEVSEDPEAGSSNILDILRKVPGVSVDAEDNVKVNGQSSFKVLMNGREDPMLKGDLKTILKSLPAASIKKIEVISEPGAKYEAEGVGGILNIVTDKSKNLSGFMTQLQGWVNAYNAGGYVNARTKLDKVMLDATVNYNNGRIWPRENKSHRETEYLVPGPNHLLSADQKARSGWDYVGGNLNLSWEPDSLNLFTLSGSYGYNTWGNHGTENRSMQDEAMDYLWQLRRQFDSEGLWTGGGVLGSYQHNFRRDDHTLVFSYEFDYGHSRNSTDYLIENILGNAGETPYSADRSKGNNYSHIFQLDYSNRFSPRHLLEAGAKGNINSDRTWNTPWFGPSKDEATAAGEGRGDTRQFKDIYALYASYAGTFGSWNVKGGVRYEHTRMGLRYYLGDLKDFTTRLNDIVPNGAVSYNITQAQSLRLAYQMRISRPALYFLNPYVNTLTPGSIQYGNPDLKSEKSHNISLAYSNYEGKFTGSVKTSYRYTANSINDIIFVKDDIIHSTYANVGREHYFGLDLQGNWNITSDLRWGIYYSVCWQQMKAASELLKAENHGWQHNVNTDLTYTFPFKMRLSAYGGFWTPWIDLQSRGTENGYYYGLGVSRSFLKEDALTVNLSASTLFPTRRTNSYVQEDESVRLRYRGTYSQWNVGLSVSFRFGGLKASMKQTAANIEKESNGSQGGGQGDK